jgi:apolipoprotein N-acyltransferase
VNFSLAAVYSRAARKRWVAFVAGCALVLSFQPFALIWLAPFSLACLILLWEGTNARQAGWVGYCFGLGLFTAGTYWLYISLNILGGLWPPVALFMMACLIAVLAIYVALTGYLAVRIAPASGLLRWLVVIPALWTLTEWLRGWLFTGFPWLSIGYSQVETPLGALAPVLGVYGVTWISVLCAGVVVCLVQGAYVARITVFVLSALALMGLLNLRDTQWTQAVDKDLRVTLVQGAVPQELKWKPRQLQPTLDLYQELSISQGERDLIIWPEAAIPALPFEVPGFLQDLNEQMVSTDTQLFTGILTYDLELGEYKNTLWAMGAEEGKYFKRHLVAFGEYFPLPDFAKKLLRIMNLPSESIMPGADEQPLLMVKGVPVAATICYEIAFAAEQLAFFPAAQLMVNVSNDAWFGDSIAPHQHLQIGQMRALETGRYLLRATNTGITAVVNPRGLVVERIPQFQPGVINAVVQPYTGGTPFVRMGNGPLMAALFVVTAIAGLFSFSRRGPKPH